MADSTAIERFTEVERRYIDAISNYYKDMVAAKTEAEAVAVEKSYQDAQVAYNSALNSALLGQGAAIEKVVKDLKAANDRVDKLRADSEALASILSAAAKAVGFAAKLVLLAS